MSDLAVGYGLLIGSIVFNGSYIAPFKLDFIRKINLDPSIFQLYVSFGILASSFLCSAFLPYNPEFVAGAGTTFSFVQLGLASGVITIGAITCSFLATERIGVAVAQGIFSGSGILTSYLISIFAFNEIPTNIPLSVFGIILLIIGVCGIAFCNKLAEKTTCVTSKIDPFLPNANIEQPNPLNIRARSNFSISTENDENEVEKSSVTNVPSFNQSVTTESFIVGSIFAIITGVLGGSCLAPLHSVNVQQSGFVFLPAFGVGAIITSPFILICKYFSSTSTPRKLPDFHMKDTLLAGFASGFIWNLNNICAVGSIPRIGYGVAYPLVQMAIFVAGAWGIYVFKEITGRAVLVFYAAALILICGAVLLTLGSIY